MFKLIISGLLAGGLPDRFSDRNQTILTGKFTDLVKKFIFQSVLLK